MGFFNWLWRRERNYKTLPEILNERAEARVEGTVIAVGARLVDLMERNQKVHPLLTHRMRARADDQWEVSCE